MGAEVRKFGSYLLAVFCFLLAAPSTGSAAPEQQARLNYLNWAKSCQPAGSSRQTCMTSSTGRIASGETVISVIVVEADTEATGTLRVVLPLGMQLVHGMRILVDAHAPVQKPYVSCYSEGGCFADYKIDGDLLQQLKTGKSLIVQGINANGAPLTFPVPLAGFELAYGGEPIAWNSLDSKVRTTQDALLALKSGKRSAEDTSRLVHGQWTRHCMRGKEANAKEVCFTGADGHAPSGALQIAAVVIEPQGEPKKILRVTLPLTQQLPPGVTLSIDDQTYKAPFILCFAKGCMADFDVTLTVGSLTRGKVLKVQATNSAGLPIMRSLPLTNFKTAYGGPPQDPKIIDALQKRLEEETAARNRMR